MISIALIGAFSCLQGASLVAENVVIIFAPGEYQHLPRANHHIQASIEFGNRFRDNVKTRYAVSMLTGSAATRKNLESQVAAAAKDAEKDDALFLVVCSYGLNRPEAYFLCSYETKLKTIESKNTDPSTLIRLDRLINDLRKSPSMRKLLIVDGAPQNVALELFNRPIRSSDGLSVFVNRNRTLDNGVSLFMETVLDGVSPHGDEDNDGVVTLFEFSRYVLNSLEEQDASEPVIELAYDDFPVTETSARILIGISDEQRQQNIVSLMRSAMQALFNDYDSNTARRLLLRASRFQPAATLQQQIDELYCTAIADIYGVRHGLEAAKTKNVELRLLAKDKKMGLYLSGESTPKEFAAKGSLLRIRKIVRQFALVDQAVHVEFVDGSISLQKKDIQQAWIKLSGIEPTKAKPDPNNVPKSSVDLRSQEAANQAVDSDSEKADSK